MALLVHSYIHAVDKKVDSIDNSLYKVAQINPVTPTVAIWVHPVPDRVKPSFVIFDIRAL